MHLSSPSANLQLNNAKKAREYAISRAFSMPEILFGLDDGTLYYANSFLEQIQKISVTLCFHLCIRHKAQGRTVDAVAHAIGGLRLAGDDIHIDALFKLIPELACERALRAALLRNTVLLRRQLVPDGFRRGLLIVARIDAQQALF